MKRFLSDHFVSLILLCVVAAIGFSTIQTGKFLLGWDVTAPELNTSLNLERSVFGVWQMYRGLGTLDGMAHTANIIHILWMALWKSIVGLQLARPTWLLALYAIGMIGAATLARKVIQNSFSSSSKLTLELSSLVVGLLYGLNLYTVQMWYAPLEVFAYQFAVLPWLLWSALTYLDTKKVRSLLVFGLICLLGIGQAHVPTVFISSSMLLGLMLFGQALYRRENLKRALLVIAVYALINAVWMLPYAYSALHKPAVIASSHINQLSTPEITVRNKAWGTLAGVVTMGSFNLEYLDWTDMPETMEYMMGSWREHYNSFWYQAASSALFILAVTGIGVCIRAYRRHKTGVLWVPVSFAIFFALLATNSLLFGWITALSVRFVPLFGEVFRFTFTKFSQPYALLLSLLVGIALAYICGLLAQKKQTALQVVAVLACIVLIAVQSFPIWKNGLFYQSLWVSVPTEYFSLANYLNKNAASFEKVAVLPSPTLYGWTSNTWGHRGSGFLWQMVKPAMLDRAFDAWSTENETYYQQLDTSISTQNPAAFFAFLKSRQVRYVLFDESLQTGSTAVVSEENAVRSWLETYANTVFSDGVLQLYELNTSLADTSVLVLENPLVVHNGSSRSQTANNSNEYVERGENSPLEFDTSFPFSFLDEEYVSSELVSHDRDILKLTPPYSSDGSTLLLPRPTAGTQLSLPFSVTMSENSLLFTGETIGSILTATKARSIANPVSFSHEISSAEFPVMVDINGQLVTIEESGNQTVWLTRLRVDEPITIRSFSQDQTTSEAEQLIVAGEVDESLISSAVWDQLQEVTAAIESSQSVPTQVLLRTSTTPIPLGAGASVENCDALNRGTVAERMHDGRLEIAAAGFANACKGFPLAPASSHDSFFVELRATTTAENGLFAAVQHWSTPRAMVYQLLTMDSEKLLLSVPGAPLLQEKNSSLLLENRSFSEEKNTATIESISVIRPAFSIPYLKNIQITPAGSRDLTFPTDTSHALTATEINPTYFQVSLAGLVVQTEQSSIVFLQSFDPGWLAFPALQPWKQLEQVKYNGWANAWIIPAGTNPERITILYWPQLLTYIGYGLLIATLSTLGWAAWKERSTVVLINQKIKDQLTSTSAQLKRHP